MLVKGRVDEDCAQNTLNHVVRGSLHFPLNSGYDRRSKSSPHFLQADFRQDASCEILVQKD